MIEDELSKDLSDIKAEEKKLYEEYKRKLQELRKVKTENRSSRSSIY